MDIVSLQWDSAFFGYSIGKVCWSGNEASDSVDIFRQEFLRASFDLVYVFIDLGGCPAGQAKMRGGVVELGGVLCDVKCTYAKELYGDSSSSEDIHIQSVATLTCEMEELAYSSGWCSRFVVDERLRSSFKPLYLAWLQKDLKEGCVFVYLEKHRVVGLATVTVKESVARIGLIAVSKDFCGCGIATKLMATAEKWAFGIGARRSVVVTQGLNLGGNRLYLRCGYKLQQKTEVWHVWKGLSNR